MSEWRKVICERKSDCDRVHDSESECKARLGGDARAEGDASKCCRQLFHICWPFYVLPASEGIPGNSYECKLRGNCVLDT